MLRPWLLREQLCLRLAGRTPQPHRSDQKQAGRPLSKGRFIDSEQWRPSNRECKAGLPGTGMTAVGRATLHIRCQVLAHSLHGLRAVMEAPLPGPGMAPGPLSTAPGERQCPAWLQVSPKLFLLELGVKGRDGAVLTQDSPALPPLPPCGQNQHCPQAPPSKHLRRDKRPVPGPL